MLALQSSHSSLHRLSHTLRPSSDHARLLTTPVFHTSFTRLHSPPRNAPNRLSTSCQHCSICPGGSDNAKPLHTHYPIVQHPAAELYRPCLCRRLCLAPQGVSPTLTINHIASSSHLSCHNLSILFSFKAVPPTRLFRGMSVL